MTVYTVWYDSGDYYDSGGIIHIFTTRELAQSFIDLQKKSYSDEYSIEEYVLDSALSALPH